jgi:hypothetical protein
MIHHHEARNETAHCLSTRLEKIGGAARRLRERQVKPGSSPLLGRYIIKDSLE